MRSERASEVRRARSNNPGNRGEAGRSCAPAATEEINARRRKSAAARRSRRRQQVAALRSGKARGSRLRSLFLVGHGRRSKPAEGWPCVLQATQGMRGGRAGGRRSGDKSVAGLAFRTALDGIASWEAGVAAAAARLTWQRKPLDTERLVAPLVSRRALFTASLQRSNGGILSGTQKKNELGP
ncbi:hypothetical protein JRQ81_017220 [Phrynocephalus forsythii]|uniref:Uncharacterized protein n=1 Tax=Phrynocephalus forsythii TaxID=171643 RepID=A0A9Q0XSB6_9SAUR|nr:hypothetical protein JRQ81_017220 [Phrynocephalus forsythii]